MTRSVFSGTSGPGAPCNGTMTSLAMSAETPRPRERELDELTLARARRGEEAACRTLVETYQARVFALVGRMLVPRGLGAHVEDVAQDTFLRAFRALPGFDPRGRARLSTWLLTIATRRSVDLLRRSGRERALSDAPPTALVIEPQADRNLLGRALLDEIGRLDAGYQAAFVLRACHDMDYAEIAAALDIEPGTVKSRISRARAKLRAALARRAAR